MSYLLPAGTARRTKNKWGLGAIILRNGGSPFPGPMPQPVFNPTLNVGFPVTRPTPIASPIIVRGPFTNAPPMPGPLPVAPSPPPDVPVAAPANAGTPVPSGFPTNQFYVAPDGSVWEYSVSGNRWFNTGTPYNVNAPANPPAPAAAASPTDGGTSQPPVSVTVSTAPTESGYQSILDWLTQQTLITGLPNWVLLAGGAVAYKMFFSGSGKGR